MCQGSKRVAKLEHPAIGKDILCICKSVDLDKHLRYYTSE